MDWLEHRVPPPVVALVLAAAMWGVQQPTPGAPLAVRIGLGVLLALVGGGFDLAGLLAFRRARTTFNPLKPERASSLVDTGVYRLTRNPMYVGMALVLSGWAVGLGSLPPLAGPVVFVLYITRFQIVPEERVLQRLFGTEFTDYRARVRRWL